MNNVYRVVWSRARGCWVVTSELTSSRSKSGRSTLRTAACSLGLLALTAQAVANDLPTGGTVTFGTGNIGSNGASMTVDQAGQRLDIDWQSFSIGPGHSVTFVQPDRHAIAFNRVIGSDVSSIQGALSANGQVFLSNPNGIVFSPTAQVNVGGLLATTLQISEQDGQYVLHGDSNAGIVQQGRLAATDGGTIALVAARIVNSGEISATRGNVLLGAGNKVTLDLGGPVKIRVENGALDALIEQGGAIRADGGVVYLTAKAADSLSSAAINHTGLTQARTLSTNERGEIVLLSDMERGTTHVAGTLDASSPNGGAGGFIETSAATVQIGDIAHVTTAAANGNAGLWLIDPTDFTIAASGGNMTGAQVTSALLGGNFTIQTTGANTPGHFGDLFVNDTVSWNSNTLTVFAHRTIEINAALHGSGTAGLLLQYGQGAAAAGNTARYIVNAPVNLASTGSFATRLGNDGAVLNYTIITDLGVAGSASGTDLQGINGNLGGRYVLGANIDASSSSAWDGGLGFTPIGTSVSPFNGTFDGLGHHIDNLAINRPPLDFVGLFAAAGSSSTIRNLGMHGGSIVGRDSVGAIAGRNQGTITDAYATTAVSGEYYVGGLIGMNFGVGTISNVYATGTVSADYDAGGLVGWVNGGSITNAYATGDVQGYGDGMGGLIGRADAGTITGVYATGAVSGRFDLAGLIAYNNGATVSDAYWATDTSGQIGSNGGVGRTLAELMATLPTGFDTTMWGNAGNQTTPYLRTLSGNRVFTVNDSTQLYTVIQTLDELQGVQNNLAARYVLGNHIDATATLNWNSGAGFTPIGSLFFQRFTGTFDGLGHHIDNLTIDDPTSPNAVGLFGYVDSNAEIRNLGLHGGSLSGYNDVGAIAGWSSGTITNAHATSTVSGNAVVGGLVGSNEGTITAAYATGAVSSSNGSGGLVGYHLAGMIADSYATGAVSGSIYSGGLVGFNEATITQAYATGAVSGDNNIGGLVGVNLGMITHAYATGAVSGTDYYLGGLAGTNQGAINNAYATGVVSGDRYLGGLVGENFGGSITDAYATGAVSGNRYLGGLVGENYDGTITSAYSIGSVSGTNNVGGLVGVSNNGSITNAYWATDTSGQISSNGGVGRTLAELMATLPTGFDTTVWGNADNQSTPYLRPLSGNRVFTVNDSTQLYTVIQTLDELQGVQNGLGGRYVLGNDIDATATLSWNSGEGFTPIGTNGWYFTGIFDGLGHRIDSLFINRPTTDYVGLFGATQINSVIRNLGLHGGSFSGADYVGSMVGANRGMITNAYATGTVSGYYSVGGLAGTNPYGTITNSYATGVVSGMYAVGGLIGHNSSALTNAYATGTVSGDQLVGGLVGVNNSGTITNTYATGAASGNYSIGGLIGQNAGTIANAYATGAVSGIGLVGGLIGDNFSTVTNAYWATDTSGQISSAGGQGRTLAELMQLSTFAAWGTDIDAQGGTGSIWRIYEGHSAPLLRSFLTALTVTADDATRTYDGLGWSDGAGITYSLTPSANLSGTASYSGTSQGAVNAGDYTIGIAGLYSNQMGYDIITANGTLTINRATLTLNAVTDGKVYDGNTNSSGVVHISGLLAADSITGVTQSFDSRHAGSRTLVVNGGYVIDDGNGGNNYVVTTHTASGTITETPSDTPSETPSDTPTALRDAIADAQLLNVRTPTAEPDHQLVIHGGGIRLP